MSRNIAPIVNIAARLSETARQMPHAPGVIMPSGRDADGKRRYRTYSFQQLDRDSDNLAYGLKRLGVTPGTRLALMVRPGFDFISLVFALFKAGAVSILIDPGMGRKNVLRCLDEVEPQGFIAISAVHALRCLFRRRFAAARFNVTVGRRWFWRGVTLKQLRRATPLSADSERSFAETGPLLASTTADDPAAIIFTTGSTGPPKGVLYRHGNFDHQVDEIRDRYAIRPGEIDVACFPLFALFNCAMGVTTIVPEMDFSRPATVEPLNIIEPINDLQATQAFASPAVWNRVGRYCEEHRIMLPTLRRVLSAGAPVPAEVLERMKDWIHPRGDVHTPYGATESLPVASISASEVLAETAQQTRIGAGVCVGRKFPGIEWRIIGMVNGPITTFADAEPAPPGEIGELIVRGPVVTSEYVRRSDANALAKIADGKTLWHRMGDVGYIDEQSRFWFCGRMAHRLLTPTGPMYTIPCEAIFNAHPKIYRSALVGIGLRGEQIPVIIVQPEEGEWPKSTSQRQRLVAELRKLGQANPRTREIAQFLVHRRFPVDIRHNVKIFREQLADWAQRQLQ